MTNDEMLSFRECELAPSPFADLTVPLGNLGQPEDHESSGDLTVGKLHVRLGDRPVAYDLRYVFKDGHGGPPDTPTYNGYDIWMIVHSMGVVRESGSASVLAMGYEAVFADERAVYTIDLLPRTEFVTRLQAGFHTRVDLGAEGSAGISAPDEAGAELAVLAGSVSLALSESASLLGKMSFSVMTPIVQAVGKGSSRCQWHFEREGKPLLGDQVMVQTILVPRRTRRLDFKIRGYAMIKPWFLGFGARQETGWMDVSCPLVSRTVLPDGKNR